MKVLAIAFSVLISGCVTRFVERVQHIRERTVEKVPVVIEVERTAVDEGPTKEEVEQARNLELLRWASAGSFGSECY